MEETYMITEQKGKKALITGASRGIGKAAAELFAKSGFDLTLVCHQSIEALEELAIHLEAAWGISCTAVRADMGCEQDVARVFSQLKEIDVLVNNAGMAHFGLL